GFVKHVFPDRIQVLGLTEIDYLLSQSPEQARAGLEAFCSKPLCCIAISRGLDPPDFLMDVARRHGVPVLRTTLMSSVFISRLTRKLGPAVAAGDDPRRPRRRPRRRPAADRPQRRRQERGGARPDPQGPPPRR